MKPTQTQQGFTLIELIVVIVILGILSAVALPKFVDVAGDARTSSIAGVAGGIASAGVTNYANKVAGKTHITLNQANICTTAILGSLLLGGWPGAEYTVSGTGACNGTEESATCTIGRSDGGTAKDTTVPCARP